MTCSRDSGSLCLNVLIFAREQRAPWTMEVWFSWSEMIRPPLPSRHGMSVELVAKPCPFPALCHQNTQKTQAKVKVEENVLKSSTIPTTIAAGLPTKLAIVFSSSTCCNHKPDLSKQTHEGSHDDLISRRHPP